MNKELPKALSDILDILQDKKVEDLQVLDVSKLVSYTDYFIIGTANNTPHAQTLINSVERYVKVPGVGGFDLENDPTASWLLFDGGDFILHIFQAETRKYYNLEELWEDAKPVAI